MSIRWPNSTNKGTALLKLAHHFHNPHLFQDDCLSWFFDEATIGSLAENPFPIDFPPQDAAQTFQQLVYWYVILREKHGDEVIEKAIASGCQQVLLLGGGYDTRFFRLASIKDNFIPVFEVDLPEIIEDKRRTLTDRLGQIPPLLSLISLDFNTDNLSQIFNGGFQASVPTAYIWQGVSYYLPQASVSRLLDFIRERIAPHSVFWFDCCSLTMIVKSDRRPELAYNIDRLKEIGEPFLFGMDGDKMAGWLRGKGFADIEILQQDDLEEKFLQRRTLPNDMWYVVTVNT